MKKNQMQGFSADPDQTGSLRDPGSKGNNTSTPKASLELLDSSNPSTLPPERLEL